MTTPSTSDILQNIEMIAIIFGHLAIAAGMLANWKIFGKANVPGWKGLIPFYNLYVLYGLTWHAILAIPVLVLSYVGPFFQNFDSMPIALLGTAAVLISGVLRAIAMYKLSKSFGHGAGFAVGLYFLEPIFMLILAFNHDEYLGNTTV